jgi:carboxypeptidase Q
MKKLSIFLLAFTAFIPARINAQGTENIDTVTLNRIRQEALQHSHIAWIAHELTDVAGPRLTNSPGWHQAADWIVKTLNGWGLSNAAVEPWGEFGYGWSAEKTSLSMRTPYYSPLIAYANPWSGSTHGPISGETYLVEEMDPDWITGHLAQMKGKILLLPVGDTTDPPRFHPDAERYTDSALAAMGDTYMFGRDQVQAILPMFKRALTISRLIRSSGALALLSNNGGRDGTVFVQSFIGYRKKDEPAAALPSLEVAKEDMLRLQRLTRDGLPVTVELQSDTKLYDQDLSGHDVVGEIPGTDPTLKAEVVMLGGHLDSWTGATGATDNGAGCIVALEAVRILKTLGLQPKRTIRIALWDGEEQGLLGSFGYVRKHFGDPETMKLKPEAARISAYYNLDNGTGKIRGIFAQGNSAAADVFRQWFVPFKDLGASTVTLHNTGSTDHLCFDAVGIPGFEFIQDPLDYETRTHHSNEDNYDHLAIEDLQQAAAIEASFVYLTAMRTGMIPRKPAPKPEKFIFDDLLP